MSPKDPPSARERAEAVRHLLEHLAREGATEADRLRQQVDLAGEAVTQAADDLWTAGLAAVELVVRSGTARPVISLTPEGRAMVEGR